MSLQVSAEVIAAAQSLKDSGDIHGAWQVLANAGDNYAASAAVITSTQGDPSITQDIVRNAWLRVVGSDVYNEKFISVAVDFH